MRTYDVIVAGIGGIGSAAAFHLAARGARVLGLDRFGGVHDRGSSHGHSRIIREAYCEHPDYVPLVQRSYALWAELEARCRRRLYYEVGLIEVGPEDGLVVPGVFRSAAEHGLRVERLDARALAERFPAFHVPESLAAVFEPRAGYLLVEECVEAYQREAARLGARLETAEVTGWRAERDGVVVHSAGESFSAGRLVVTAGAWTQGLLRELGVRLTVLRKPQNWFATTDPRYLGTNGCPGFLFEVPAGIFYGFPQLDARGVKVGEHSGGVEVEVADPTKIDRGVDLDQRGRAEAFLREYLPGVTGPARDHAVCMYTMSPDGHFLLDRHPEEPRVCFAAGLSGHGFKFAPVLGEALADLALEDATALPVGFLGCSRFG